MLGTMTVLAKHPVKEVAMVLGEWRVEKVQLPVLLREVIGGVV